MDHGGNEWQRAQECEVRLRVCPRVHAFDPVARVLNEMYQREEWLEITVKCNVEFIPGFIRHRLRTLLFD